MLADSRLSFLFATWEGGGNIPPALTVVRALIAAGHRVRVMCDRCSSSDILAAGAEFVPWRRAPCCSDRSEAALLLRDWEAATPEEGFGRLRDAIMFGPALAYAQDLLNEIRSDCPDLVVGSDMLFGVMAACEADRQPLALLATNLSLYPIDGIPPFGAGLMPAQTAAERALHDEIAAASGAMFNAGLPALNAARNALGLQPLSHVFDQLRAADRMLLATSRAFDFPAECLPGHIRYVGPLLGEPHWSEPWRSPWTADARRPLVLVAFSSTFQDQAAVLQRVTNALAALPVRAVVTLGPGLAADAVKCSARNVVVCRSAPHDAIMREAAVVVTHGGHGTVMRALAHRVPILCMPMGRDQNDNAVRVVARGAGLNLPPAASSSEISGALRRLLEDPAFAQSARQLGDAVAAEAAASTAPGELVECAALYRASRLHRQRNCVKLVAVNREGSFEGDGLQSLSAQAPDGRNREERTMVMTREEMDHKLDEHFGFEARDDVEGVLATLAADAEHDIVGWPTGPTLGREGARPFYVALFADLSDGKVKNLRRLYGDNFLIDESYWEGIARGRPFGLEGRNRPLGFRLLHVIEFAANGQIKRENVWVDMAAIVQQLPQYAPSPYPAEPANLLAGFEF